MSRRDFLQISHMNTSEVQKIHTKLENHFFVKLAERIEATDTLKQEVNFPKLWHFCLKMLKRIL